MSLSSRIPARREANALARELARLRAEARAAAGGAGASGEGAPGAGRALINLAESNPTRVGLSAPLALALGELCDPGCLRYEPDPRGLSAAREALAERLAARAAAQGGAGCGGPAAKRALRPSAPGPEELFLCASTSEAYSWLFKLLCDPGDAVLVPKPGYPLFDQLAGLEAVEARPYRLEYAHPWGWRIDLESLEAAAAAGRARALVLINPNNPTGSYIGAEEREAVIGLCERRGIALIVDEVFLDFPVEGFAAGGRGADGHGAAEASPPGGGFTPPRPAPSFAGEARVLTFVLDGLSKSLGAPQMKLGWIACSGPRAALEEAREGLEIVADSFLSAGTPVMRALPAWLPLAAPFAETLLERARANLGALRRVLEAPGSPHRVLRCEGGWTALVESPRYEAEEELALGLLREEGLATHPGYFYDMGREAFFTASLILPEEELLEAARRYAAFFARLGGS